MPLECTVLCVDNSPAMRNCDYPSGTRLEVALDTSRMIALRKLGANVESTVGLVSLGALTTGCVEVKSSPSNSRSKLEARLAEIKLGGEIKFANGLRVAMLCLQKRANKRGESRIVAFVGSSVEKHLTEKSAKKLGAELRKNGVNLDVICLETSQSEAGMELLRTVVDTANKNEASHLVIIPKGAHVAEAVRQSPILRAPGTGGSGTVGSGAAGSGGNLHLSSGNAGGASGGAPGNDMMLGGGFGFEGSDIDPNQDPELALALRLSMETAMQQASANNNSSSSSSSEGQEGTNNEGTAAADQNGGFADMMMDDEMDAELQAALALSMQVNDDAKETGDGNDEGGEDNDTGNQEGAGSQEGGGEEDAVNQAFLQNLLASLPGVDPNNVLIQTALEQAAQGGEDKESKDDESDTKND